MSTLASTYALACGVPLSEPWINDTFFPLETSLDKVILIHAFAGKIEEQNGGLVARFPAKIFDYFAEVVSLLAPIVQPLGYRFYQIGAANEPHLKGAQFVQTNMSQCAYLVKNAALFMGNDSMWAHIRGAAKKPLIELFGATDRKNHGPEWFNPDCSVFLESHRMGRKPSYATMEPVKTVNFIPPEDVANSALRLLGLPESIKRKSYYIGQDYQSVLFEIVPNCAIAPQINVGIPVIRMDYFFNEEVMIQNLQIRKCAIVTKQEINLNYLVQLKSHINSIRVEVDRISPEWLKALKRTGIPAQYVSEEKDPDKLAALRLKLYDVCLFDQIVYPTREDLKKEISIYLNKSLDTDFNLATLKFKSNHFVLADGKVYTSKSHWVMGKGVGSTDENECEVIDTDEFWTDQKSFYFYTT